MEILGTACGRKTLIRHGRGNITIAVLIFSSLGVFVMSSLVNWALLNSRLNNQRQAKELAFQIAEAGIEYYRWHLAHAPGDFQDGTGLAGPYYHNFENKAGAVVGQFRLEITPPPSGSTKVIITSTATTTSYANVKRVIRAQYAIPSLAKYAVVANDVMRFGSGTETFGPIHSNNGIRFDGLAHNLITSGVANYNDPDHSGNNEFGVHTHVNPVDPLPPAAVPVRTDVFIAGRQFPVPAVDFPGLTSDLSSLKSQAQSGGIYLSGSGYLGYRMVLKTNDTFDLYRVTSLSSAPSRCTNSQSQTGWGTWSVNAQTLLGNYNFPGNGIIFVEDHLWVEGIIQTARLTIAAGRFPETPSTNASITVNANLKYTTYDAQDALALIAQNNFNVGLNSADTLQIDAAIIAKNGRAGRYYYSSFCGGNYVRTKITLNGMIATNQRYGFAYTDGTGYVLRSINYDTNLLYAPPPSFPLASSEYQIISWEDISN